LILVAALDRLSGVHVTVSMILRVEFPHLVLSFSRKPNVICVNTDLQTGPILYNCGDRCQTVFSMLYTMLTVVFFLC